LLQSLKSDKQAIKSEGTIMGDLERDIEIFLEVQRTVNMGVFDNWFTEEARSKRQATPEETYYSQERKQEELSRTDFSSVWAGVSVEHGGMRDGNAPQAWAQKYYDLQKKEQKQLGIANIEGYACQFDSDTGYLTIQSPTPSVQLSPKGALDLVAFIMRGAPPAMPIQGAFPGGQAHAPVPVDAVQKERMERNIKEMERWALASSKSYPRGK
jgi:hypothetical protein